MKKTIKINGEKITLCASVWTWIEYKRIFKRDWTSDRNAQFANIIKAVQFAQEFSSLTDEDFAELPEEEQTEYWQRLSENQIDLEFALDTIYAMAVAGGYQGTLKEMFENIPPQDLAPDSELMAAFGELVNELSPEVKKKT